MVYTRKKSKSMKKVALKKERERETGVRRDAGLCSRGAKERESKIV